MRLTQITGAAWPASGAASTGTTGFNSLSGTWTHVAGDAPAGSGASGYIKSPAGVAGNFTIGDPGTAFTGTNDYWVRFYIRLHLTGAAPAATTAIIQHSITSTGTKARAQLYSAKIGSTQDTALGVGAVAYGFVGSPTYKSGNGITSATKPAEFPYEKWVEVAIHLNRTNGGPYEVYVGGVLTYEARQDQTQIALADANSAAQWLMGVLGVANVEVHVSGPCECWSGTDIVITPAAQQQLPWVYRPTYAASNTNDNGLLVKASGTATITPTHYTVANYTNPQSYRFVGSGTNGQTMATETTAEIGALPYNGDGTATICAMMVYVPDGSASFRVRNPGNTADLIKLDVNTATGKLLQGATVLANWDKTHRYSILLTLGSSGSAEVHLVDLTSTTFAAGVTQKATLANWTPGAVGKLRVEQTIGASNAAVECDGFYVADWALLALFDSLTSTSAGATVPAIATPNHIIANTGDWDHGLPICANTWTDPWGTVRKWFCWPVLGRSGNKTVDWDTYERPQWTGSRGFMFVHIDGGSINDISVNTTAANLRTAKQSFLANVLPGNRLIVPTMIRREQGTSTDAQLVTINAYNNFIREDVRLYQNGSIAFCDPAALVAKHVSLFTAGDDTHFNVTGDQTVRGYLWTNATIPTRIGSRRHID